jgi:hypothetical protein
MYRTYHVFGLKIKSVIPLPALLISDSLPELEPDIVIEYGKTPEALTNPKFKGCAFRPVRESF